MCFVIRILVAGLGNGTIDHNTNYVLTSTLKDIGLLWNLRNQSVDRDSALRIRGVLEVTDNHRPHCSSASKKAACSCVYSEDGTRATRQRWGALVLGEVDTNSS